MKFADIFIRIIRNSYRLVVRKKFLPPDCDCDRQTSNDRIYNLLASGTPCMVSRFGTVELNCLTNYLCIHSKKNLVTKIWNFITDNTHTPWWYDKVIYALYNNAGVFPKGEIMAELFSERYLKDIPQIDLLACHQYYEKFMPLRDDIQRVQLEMLYPFYVERPWSRILKGKKVLVVHPFTETIKQQYEKRDLLFDNKEILPDFELITFQAVQTIAGNTSEFKNWFDALSYMEKEVSKIDFDIAIIGCGAYGLPLAAYVKRMGKQAIHLAGGTQLLFGILGKRWTEQYQSVWKYRPGVEIDINYRPLFNDNWVAPGISERPKNLNNVENGCYW